MDTASVVSGPGAWLRNPGQLPEASKHNYMLQNSAHGTPGSHNLHDTEKVLVRSLC
jgi:hypothetical protein